MRETALPLFLAVISTQDSFVEGTPKEPKIGRRGFLRATEENRELLHKVYLV
jgi:hypothetical protein